MTTAFTIPKIPIPTLEQRRAASAEWIEPLRPCLYTNWPTRYKELSFKTAVEELTPMETADLSAIFGDDPKAPLSEGLQRKIDRAARHFTNGCFFKFESRSPKDNYWGEMTNFRCCSHHDVKKLLYSERLLDDLVRYTYLESEPLRLLFREWHPIRKASEFRCFIRARKLAGISQYHTSAWDDASHKNMPTPYANIYAGTEELNTTLTSFIAGEIIPHLHTDDIVADLWLEDLGKVTLIEINPFGLSDPCLFTYADLENYPAELRFVEPRGHRSP